MQEHNDIRGKPLILLDLRHKIPRGDGITYRRTYINRNKITSDS